VEDGPAKAIHLEDQDAIDVAARGGRQSVLSRDGLLAFEPEKPVSTYSTAAARPRRSTRRMSIPIRKFQSP